MYCKEMLGSLSDYIDGDLEAQLCAEIEQHMAGCGNCRVVVDTLSKTVSLYRESATSRCRRRRKTGCTRC